MKQTNLIKNALLWVLICLSISCKTSDKSEIKNQVLPIKSVKIDYSKYLKRSELEAYVLQSEKLNLKELNLKPFDTLKFDKIIAYDFEGSEEPNPSVIGKNDKFTNVILKQKYLNEKQGYFLIKCLTSNATYGGSFAACFNPHLGFVFFDHDKVVYTVDVCLGCNYLISTSDIPAMNSKMINKGTEDAYPAFGFSKAGKKKIRKLCKELDFFYGNENSK
ncbi:hypothetical protein [Flavobacterium sp.]|uniref:hypothetical protein n=1 Tax=Flavobacterium sp. TaxID=239 RepID=UPI003750C289